MDSSTDLKSQLDFEWPSQEDLDSMQLDPVLESIQFNSWSDRPGNFLISAIQINLSNGLSSPLFGVKAERDYTQKIWLNSDQQIRAVSCEQLGSRAKSVFFYDCKGRKIAKYKPGYSEV